MTKRILAPYGIEPKKLKQHLIDIGFTKTNVILENSELDFSFVNYKKEEEKFIMTPQDFENYYNYDDVDFDTTQWAKFGLQIQIDYPYRLCLICPFDDGDINYDEICEDNEENQQYNNEESDDDNDDYINDFSYRKKYYY